MSESAETPGSIAGSSPSPSASFAPAPVPGPSGPPPRSSLARRLWPVLAGLVVVVLVLSLLAAGVFTSSSTNAATPTYSRASGSANQASRQVSGGPWDLVAAVAYDTPTGVWVSAGASVGANCTLSSTGSGPPPTSLYVPPFDGSFSSGESPWWGMIYTQPSTHQVLLVEVLNGTAETLGVGTGACVTAVENFTTIPSDAVDSSVAASVAWSQGGSAFVAAHSGLSLSMEMGLIGGGTFRGLPVGATWVVEIDPCGVFGSSGPSGAQPDFEAIVDAETGDLTLAETSSTTCGSMGPTTTPLGTVFAMGSPALLSSTSSTGGCTSGDSCYRVTVEAVTGTLTPANLTFSVLSATGALESGVRGFALLSVLGLVVVSSAGNPSSGLWVSGTGNSTTPLVAGMTIVSDVGSSNPTGSNYRLEATGLGSFSGTVTLALP